MLSKMKFAVAAATTIVLSAGAASATDPTFVTLGTASGPIPRPARAQPANLLISGDQMILVDVGDGAAQQVGKAGVPFEKIQSVFISHLHFDHTGGLFALLSRRFQVLAPAPITIYGPPGTKATVDALVQAMLPATEAAANIRERSRVSPAETVQVVELSDGWSGRIGNIAITVAGESAGCFPSGAGGRIPTLSCPTPLPGGGRAHGTASRRESTCTDSHWHERG
ncbi:MBL fold metallo-hydrolase [Sphingobium sp. SCG-1]|uniref:MBL fold metallo-hydrolase n=1 Tax=Sphingobium sp. SCG-1 TaxID=2072936 RepID=UPI00166F7E19|nr:MBL fold metallo-hydrolase [Sphingobium sp. SCG-1]